MAFQLLPAGIEEGHFQQVPEGWLFTTPSPWVFASRRTYLLSDAQKPAIAARARRGVYLRLLWPALLLPIFVAIALTYPVFLNASSAAAWIGFVVIAVALTVAISLSDYLNVRPLLKDIPLSSRKMQWRDRVQGQTQALSVKALAIFTLIFIVGFLANCFTALTAGRANPFAAIGAIAMVVPAIIFSRMLVLRLRARQAEDAASLTPEQLSARLGRIERTSMLHTFGFVALVILAFIAGILIGNLYDKSDNPSVQTLVLRNAQGNTTASLRTGADGQPMLALFDGRNGLRAAIGLSKSGTPFVTFMDGVGIIRSSMTMLSSPDAAKQNGLLQFYDSNGALRLSATIDDSGPHIRTLDQFGKELPSQRP
jgi:hypothetical protein